MNADDRNRLNSLLRDALPVLGSAPEPPHDLWPALQQRLHTTSEPAYWAWLEAPWIDAVLLAGLALFVLAVPASIPVLLYYL